MDKITKQFKAGETLKASEMNMLVNKTNEIIDNNVGVKNKNLGEIFNKYDENIANGQYSHAEGFATLANGNFSHAEGLNTFTIGAASHSEGIATNATGYASHAEGNNVRAISNYSHAEGFLTLTDCYSSPGVTGLESGIHAEGYRTCARNEGAHAEGYGINNFTFTWNDKSGNAYKTSLRLNLTNLTQEDLTNIYKGLEVFKNDDGTIIGNIKSIVLKDTVIYIEFDQDVTPSTDQIQYRFSSVISNGFGAHAEGQASVAHGRAAHAENIKNTAFGDASHAEGFSTTTKGQFSHAEGQGTQTLNSAEHAEGKYNKSHAKTISSVGVGKDNSNRSNAIEVLEDGSIYINGIGGYTGKEDTFDNVKSLLTVIAELIKK